MTDEFKPCPHKMRKSMTTDAGMVYACETCSHHWFEAYGEHPPPPADAELDALGVEWGNGK